MANAFPLRENGSANADGFNVIAHLSASSGLGNTARLFIEVLRRNGVAVAGLDVDYTQQHESDLLPAGIEIVKDPAALPYANNLIIVSVLGLPNLWRKLPGLLNARFRNAALIFWELPVMPNAWKPSLSVLDAILVCSPYVRHAVELAVPQVPTLLLEHPLAEPERLNTAVLSDLGIEKTDFTCCASFDLRSDLARKNPQATIKAFQRAFPDEQNVQLLIKTNARPTGAMRAQETEALSQQIVNDKRITLVASTLPYTDVLSLYASCDSYISLHRSEGLGLGPMEAMLLGKPVVATGYSGNMGYMTQQNSVPVNYTLVEPINCGWQFRRDFAGPGAAWAEADTQQAAEALRKLKHDHVWRAALGARARADIQERQKMAWSGDFIAPLCKLLDRHIKTEERSALQRQVIRQEFLDPTLLSRNIGAAFNTLRAKFGH
jgi:glycosyltransferase involved in cell wall biosynthesis